ncbi:MAG: S41 family peptidase [Saprospiraceae bacterium]
MKHLAILLLFISTALSAQMPMEFSDQQSTVRKNISEAFSMISYLKECKLRPISSIDSGKMNEWLEKTNLNYSTDPSVRIANDTLHIKPSSNKHLFKSNDGLYTVYMEEFEDTQDLNVSWEAIRALRKVLWGYWDYYFKFDTAFNASLNVMFHSSNSIIVMQRVFPFTALNYDDITKDQWKQIDETNAIMMNILKKVGDLLTSESDKIYAPTNGKLFPRQLTSAERIYGFVQFWTEVKYNFAFFDQVPELNWDDVLLEYVPKFATEQSTADYYKLLTEVCARLHDGHTNIYNPFDLNNAKYYPNIELRSFDDGIYVVNTSAKYQNSIPLGSKITDVNGDAVNLYLKNHLYPYISASTDYIKTGIALRNLFEIPENEKIKLGFVTPTGKQLAYQLINEQDTTSWLIPEPKRSQFDFETLDNQTAWLKINTFDTETVVDKFVALKDTLKNFNKLIIDLRENGGGNSSYGYEILKYFSKKPFLTSKWITREHKAAYKAWGRYVEGEPTDPSERECLLTYQGNFWHVAPPDTIVPYYDELISIPLVILIGNNTASAAEDFLIAAENAGFTETVGDLTFASTGQPLFFKMPGGGSARVCTKKDTYPDGREFVGYGVKPKHLVKPSLKDVMEKRDVVLEYAQKLK